MSTAPAEPTYTGPAGAKPAPARGQDTARHLQPGWKQKFVCDDGTVLYDDEAAAAFNREWEAGRFQGIQRDIGNGAETHQDWRRRLTLTTNTARPCSRARSSRRSAPGRRQGSRRTGSRAGPSDDDGESEPPGLRLWRHPDYGPLTPNLYRLLLRKVRR